MVRPACMSASARRLDVVPLDPVAALQSHYARVVDEKFEGRIPRDYRIVFNPHLRRLTGRITYREKLIEIAEFHYLQYGFRDAVATLEHELLHLYLHCLGQPSGHTKEFKRLAAKKGIRVYHANDYPRNRPSPWRYVYTCGSCQRLVFRVRKIPRPLACGVCCRAHTGGKWDWRYELRLLSRVRMA